MSNVQPSSSISAFAPVHSMLIAELAVGELGVHVPDDFSELRELDLRFAFFGSERGFSGSIDVSPQHDVRVQ